jgi:hypothetical protein
VGSDSPQVVPVKVSGSTVSAAPEEPLKVRKANQDICSTE